MHYAKLTQLSMIESLDEKIEINLSSLSIGCSSFQSLAAAELKRGMPRDVCALGTFNRM